MKPIRVVVVDSSSKPGFLSLRVSPDDETATPLYYALTASGAKPGDVLELRMTTEREPPQVSAAPAPEPTEPAPPDWRTSLITGRPVGHSWSCRCIPCSDYNQVTGRKS